MPSLVPSWSCQLEELNIWLLRLLYNEGITIRATILLTNVNLLPEFLLDFISGSFSPVRITSDAIITCCYNE